MRRKRPSHIERIAYAFQGGGALGAYQLGIFKALSENNYPPDWVIGTSIGAINSCIIAGNRPEKRLEKLETFWRDVALTFFPGVFPKEEQLRKWHNFISAQSSLFLGQPGFFYPRLNNPWFEIEGTADTLSFYDTSPLRKTLTSLIDFDLLNSGKVRVTLGAVEIEEGRGVFFDSTHQEITLDHVMASCALPPGFGAVNIRGKYYWDGGVLSNTPIKAIINDCQPAHTVCFIANLFDSFGLSPTSLDDVLRRHKDIQYSSKDRMHLRYFADLLRLRQEINHIYHKLPEDLKNDPHIKHLHETECQPLTVHFVRFLYTAPSTELSSKDFEFSTLSIRERAQAGYQDGLAAIKQAPWLTPIPDTLGVTIHQIRTEGPPPPAP